MCFFVKSLNGCVRSLKLPMNFEQYVASPRKLLTSFALVGGGALWITSTFTGCGDIPSLENTKLKNVSLSRLNLHLSLLRVSPLFEKP